MQNKNQHTVTRAYLEGFIDRTTPSGMEPYIWIYERGVLEPFKKSPKKLAVRPHYYSFNAKDGTRNLAADDLLTRFEGPAMPLLRDLGTGRDPASLSEQERETFAFFVALLAVRVPKHRDNVERALETIATMVLQTSASQPEYFERVVREAHRSKGVEPPADIEALRQATLDGTRYRIRADPLHSLQNMVDMAPHIAYHVSRCQWRVLEAPEDSAFVTSDGPLVLVTTAANLPRWAGVGWLTPKMEATLPLTPRACLLMSVEHPGGRERATAAQVREINTRTAAHAHEQIYTSRALRVGDLDPPDPTGKWSPATDAFLQPSSESTAASSSAKSSLHEADAFR